MWLLLITQQEHTNNRRRTFMWSFLITQNSTRTYARTPSVLFALILPLVPVLNFTHTFAQTALFGQCYHVHPHEKNSFSDFNNHNCHTNRKPQKQKGTKTEGLALIAVFTVDNNMMAGGGPAKTGRGEPRREVLLTIKK